MSGILRILGIAIGIGGLWFFFAIRWRDRFDKRMRMENPQHATTPVFIYMNKVSDPVIASKVPLLAIGCILSGGVGFYYAGLLGDYLFPFAVFAIGDGIRVYQSIENLRSTLIWGLGITFILGVVSGLVANHIYSKRRAT
jgi:hypothetical protein